MFAYFKSHLVAVCIFIGEDHTILPKPSWLSRLLECIISIWSIIYLILHKSSCLSKVNYLFLHQQSRVLHITFWQRVVSPKPFRILREQCKGYWRMMENERIRNLGGNTYRKTKSPWYPLHAVEASLHLCIFGLSLKSARGKHHRKNNSINVVVINILKRSSHCKYLHPPI